MLKLRVISDKLLLMFLYTCTCVKALSFIRSILRYIFYVPNLLVIEYKFFKYFFITTLYIPIFYLLASILYERREVMLYIHSAHLSK